MIENVREYVVSIRFKNSKKPYSFKTNDPTIKINDVLVVETARGLEIGTVISQLIPLEKYNVVTPLKDVIRKASVEDIQQDRENLKHAKIALKKCQQLIEKLELDMNLISAEYTLDRSKILFVYVSENRVDFRELLKELATLLHCRIELRQIGPRDKAKMIGGIGPCGMETCCSRFMSSFDVISINMAKNQLLPLNIPKLSGQCGKLMCCLKYEDDVYTELCKELPKLNAQVQYEGINYRVTSMNVLNRIAKLENKETSQFISLDDLLTKGIFKKRETKKHE